MSKRPSLAETMRQAATAPDLAPPVLAPAPAKELKPAKVEARFYAATRVGKKKVTAALIPSDHKRLRQLGLEIDSTTEALLVEAISDLFVKHGKRAIGQE